jgi:hypothetical protein
MAENDFLSDRTPEQDEAADDTEINPDAGVTDGDEAAPPPGETPEPPERAREQQAGL